MKLPVCAIFLALLPGVSLAASTSGSVSVQQGNIVYVAPGGATEVLTESGVDDAPVLSPDGALVAFTRLTRDVDEAHDSPAVRDLWVIRLNDHRATRVVIGKPEGNEKPEQVLADADSPRFSPDSSIVYFLTAASTASAAVHSVRAIGGGQRFVTLGNAFAVVQQGKYKGALLVEQHRDMNDQMPWDPEVLVSSTGTKIKVVGEDANALQKIEAERK